MGSNADDPYRKEAARLLDAITTRQAAWPKPTGLNLYKPRLSDVIISTYPKAGTTLLQNMAYQIAVATGGAPSNDPDGTHFKDITVAVPWIEYGPEFGAVENDTTPRLFKTHGRANIFDLEKASYIYCIRNPESYPASWMDFLFDVLVEEEVTDEAVREASFHLFARRRLLGLFDHDPSPLSSDGTWKDSIKPGPWFTHVNEWIDTPRPNVLILFYEDIVKDLRKTALCVAKFMNRSLSNEALKTVVHRCDRRTMAGDQRFNVGVEGVAFKFSPNAEKAKPEGRQGFKRFKIKDEDKAIVSKMMEVTFGVDSYAKLKSIILQRQQDSFPESAYRLQ